ncbi:MAG: uroporphyrinogen-III synthase [Candidatus Riflebacteria bacterium]|nr:uroporphyrinogen-III synthase [Candidatus Riflebacteria bacterium]
MTPDVVPDTYVAEALLPHFRAAAPPESSTHAFPVSSISEAAPRASSCQLPGRVSGPGKAGDGSPPTPASGQNGFATGVATGDGTASRVRRVAILRAETARDVLPDTLTREGWKVDVVVLYRTLSETAAPPAALAALRERRVDAVTFTSSSTVDGFLGLIEGQNLALEDIPAVSIGPVTADTIRRHGLRLLGTAPVHTIPGLVDQLLDLFRP